jgi:anti-sigma B factor antagonist
VAVVVPEIDFIDASNSQEFKQEMTALLEKHGKVVLDISHLRFVDSSGLGAILICRRKLAASGGDLKLLCDKSKPVRMFFELVRMNRIIDIYTTRQEAFDSFAAPHEKKASTASE